MNVPSIKRAGDPAMSYFRPKTLSSSATYRSLPRWAIYRDAAVLSTAIDRGALSLSKGNASAPTCPARSSRKRCVPVGVTPIDSMVPLSEAHIDEASHLVGQMGTEAFCRALQADAEVVIAGRACDTAIFAAVPALLGCAMGPAMHMAKILECASLCCVPGGRDPILATLEGDSFVLESMNPERRATPMSVAAHSLYEQSDPDRVAEPEGVLLVRSARYEEIDDYRRSTSPPRESSERDRGFESRFLHRGVSISAGSSHGRPRQHRQRTHCQEDLAPLLFQDLRKLFRRCCDLQT